MIRGVLPASTSHPPTTTDYLRALGLVFQNCRGQKTISNVVREIRGRLSRSTVHRLEQGAEAVTVRSQIELASFYGLTLADVHRRAWDLLGQPLDGPPAASLSISLSREDRDAVIRVLTSRSHSGPRPVK